MSPVMTPKTRTADSLLGRWLLADGRTITVFRADTTSGQLFVRGQRVAVMTTQDLAALVEQDGVKYLGRG